MNNEVIFSTDLITDLEKILAVNTDAYRSDFYCYDAPDIEKAACECCKGGMGVHFLWMARRYGTYLVPEREAFIKGTSGQNSWCAYKESRYERPLAFAIQIQGMDKHGKIIGTIYGLDYKKSVETIEAEKRNRVNIIIKYRHYTGDIFYKHFEMQDYAENMEKYSNEYGIVMEKQYEISDETVLLDMLYRMRMSRGAVAVETNMDSYISDIAEKRLTAYGYTAGDMVITSQMEAEYAYCLNLFVYMLRRSGEKALVCDKKQISEHSNSKDGVCGMFGMKPGNHDQLYDMAGELLRRIKG